MTVPNHTRTKAAVCQDCFISLEKYDEHQYLANEIEIQLLKLFHKTNLEKDSVDKKESSERSRSAQKMRFECLKCGKIFHILKDVKNHRHSVPRRKSSKSESEEVTEDFINKHASKYDFEVFQRTFFTDHEKTGAGKKTSRIRRGKISLESRALVDYEVSEEFKQLAKEHGIKYDVAAFHKAFRFSELELEAQGKKIMKTEDHQAKLHSTDKYPKPKSRMNEKFVETLRNDGIEYNLSVFQKAFGCPELNTDPHQNRVEQNSKDLLGKCLECKLCEISFKNRTSLVRHSRVHSPKDKSLYCEKCLKSFKTSACLQIHLATDHGRNDGPFDCPICFKSFQDRSALRSHFYIHNSERNFLCGR